MKKRFGAFVLCMVLAVSLLGCGSAQAGDDLAPRTGAQENIGPSDNTGANLNPDSGNNPTVSDAMPQEDFGSSYEQMLRNAYVHDSDGILTDGENSVS